MPPYSRTRPLSAYFSTCLDSRVRGKDEEGISDYPTELTTYPPDFWSRSSLTMLYLAASSSSSLKVR